MAEMVEIEISARAVLPGAQSHVLGRVTIEKSDDPNVVARQLAEYLKHPTFEGEFV